MKKILSLSATCLALAACTNESLVDNGAFGTTGTDGPISFVMEQRNMTRATSDLQKTGHYNFGVFAYKSTETVNNIMANYLVGYNGTNEGYYMTESNQTTLGDEGGLVDGKSKWQYEGLGYSEYTYSGEGFYKASQTDYMSNEPVQFLRYWDKAAGNTNFYAYGPYINGGGTVTYVDGTAQQATGNDTYVMCFPNGTMTDGYNDASLLEYMWASAKVVKADYGHDVSLNFQRLNAKVNIKFWEDIPGYSVRILDLKEGEYPGVQAAASIKDKTSNKYGYKPGKYWQKNGVKIQFNANAEEQGIKQFQGTAATNTTTLKFDAPADAQIGESRVYASASPTTYYAIPKGQGGNLLAGTSTDYSDEGTAEEDAFGKTGFTFHVTFELTSTTGERIVVKNATVHVPAEFCNWKPNTHYTYIFKITRNANGSTDPAKDGTIDPTDPEVPTEASLYPIVFDNCTITDYDEIETEHEITEGAKLAYYDVQLSTYSITNTGTITVTIDQINDYAFATNAPDYTNVTVTKADGTADPNVTYNSATKTITVATGASGKYIVTYTCADADIDANHPRTWTETFWVGNAYTLSTNLDEVGTHGLENAVLVISARKDGTVVNPSADELYIEYPVNLSDAEKNLVKVTNSGRRITVNKNATPGTYKLVYKIDEGNGVKVAETVFNVVDYQFALDKSVVYLNGDQTVVGNKLADADHVYTVTGGFTVTGSSIAVPANTAEGTYTVTYTLYPDGAAQHVSTVQYQQTFEVRNTHSVALSATSMDRDKGTSTPGEYTKDFKTITTFQNGSATTDDRSAKLSIVKADGTATAAGDFKITYTSGNSYTLEVKNNVDPGNYRVKFVSTVAGNDQAEYFDFVVTE